MGLPNNDLEMEVLLENINKTFGLGWDISYPKTSSLPGNPSRPK